MCLFGSANTVNELGHCSHFVFQFHSSRQGVGNPFPSSPLTSPPLQSPSPSDALRALDVPNPAAGTRPADLGHPFEGSASTSPGDGDDVASRPVDGAIILIGSPVSQMVLGLLPLWKEGQSGRSSYFNTHPDVAMMWKGNPNEFIYPEGWHFPHSRCELHQA